MFSLIPSAQKTLKSVMCVTNVPNLICAHQMCSKCEVVNDFNVDCEQCEKSAMFGQETVGKFID